MAAQKVVPWHQAIAAAIGTALILWLLHQPVQAADMLLRVKVNLVQCGHQKDIPQTCAEDPRCCTFLEDEQSRQIASDKNQSPPNINEGIFDFTPQNNITTALAENNPPHNKFLVHID